MVLGVGMGKQVVGDAKQALRLEEAGMIVFKDFPRRLAFLLSAHHDGRAVRVAAAHHQHAAALQALVAREDVRRQIGAGDVPHMQVAIGVRPGDANQDVLGGHRVALVDVLALAKAAFDTAEASRPASIIAQRAKIEAHEVWRSLVAHLHGVQGVPSSNLGTSTERWAGQGPARFVLLFRETPD
jgi:hypothetical protein